MTHADGWARSAQRLLRGGRIWAVLALAFLLFRPQGLFGERIIERV